MYIWFHWLIWAKCFEVWEDGYKTAEVPCCPQDFYLELGSWEHTGADLKLSTWSADITLRFSHLCPAKLEAFTSRLEQSCVSWATGAAV